MGFREVAETGESKVFIDTSRPLNFSLNLEEQLRQSQKNTAWRVVAHIAFGTSSE
jgi:hypothetical protein